MCLEFGYEWRNLPEAERSARLRRAAEKMLARPHPPQAPAEPKPEAELPAPPVPAPA
jgi:hypothetical protein